jgi:L-seryl-tRNA(Ser) seleniumtransferase
VVDAADAVGGGAYPGVELEGCAIALPGPAEDVARRLRLGTPRVVGRIRDGRLLLHPRTVAEPEEAGLLDAVVSAGASHRAR